VTSTGVVVNMNDDPPFKVANGLVTAVDIIAKSLETPVVAPLAPETKIVHTIGSPTREGAVLIQERLDAEVGFP
jgi:hypothetical protein